LSTKTLRPNKTRVTHLGYGEEGDKWGEKKKKMRGKKSEVSFITSYKGKSISQANMIFNQVLS